MGFNSGFKGLRIALVCYINCAGNLHEEDYSTESQCDKTLEAVTIN